MDTHEYANNLKKVADELLKRDAFPLPSYDSGNISLYYYHEKEPFITGVKALGSGKKDLTDSSYVYFLPSFGGIKLCVSKDAVCRKVQDVKYECEPLLNALEEQVIDAAASAPSEEVL